MLKFSFVLDNNEIKKCIIKIGFKLASIFGCDNKSSTIFIFLLHIY